MMAAASVTPVKASPELLAREALMQLAERVADREEISAADLLERGPARNDRVLYARWTFVWAARIVLYAKDWQIADLVGWSRELVRVYHRNLQERIDVDHAYRDRLDLAVRELFNDVAWKRPLKAALKAHFEATDGRRA